MIAALIEVFFRQKNDAAIILFMENNKRVKIAAIQTKVSADKEANLKKTLGKVEQAAKKGAKIICLPELYRTIYFPQKISKKFDQYAENIPGESTEAFSRLAQRYQVVIIVPLYERAKEGHYYNSAVIIDETGKIKGTYRKNHIPHDPCFWEKKYFEEGNTGYKIFKTKFATFAVLICFDQWFPEAARLAALQGAEIIFYPTAIGNILNYETPEGDWHDAWETIQRGHSIANSVYVVTVNRVGIENKLKFWGQSFVSDPFGKIVKRASANREENLIAELDLEKNKLIRDSWGFFKNRRPGTYSRLIKK